MRLLRLLTLLLLAFCAPLACGGEAVPGDEFEGQTVQEIVVRGLTRLDEGAVLRMIRTRKGRPFDRKIWDEDWHRLDESGYFKDIITAPPAVYPGGIQLAIDLVERAIITKILFKDNKAVSSSKLLTTIKSYEGGRYDKGQINLDKLAIEKYYQDKAYRDVKVDFKEEVVASHTQMVAGKENDVPDEIRVTFNLNEGHPVAVQAIHFVGNKAFSENALRAAITTKHRRLFRAGDLKDEELDLDQKRLEMFYLRHGYMDITIEKVDINVAPDTYWNWFRTRKVLADIVFHIIEGPQYHSGKVNITGCHAITAEEIAAVMKVKLGSVYSELLLQDDHDHIVNLYGELGRVFTKVHLSGKLVTDPERLRATPNIYDVDVQIEEGAEISLHEIITRGNTKTKDKVIIREIELFPGDRLDSAKIKAAQGALKKLNYFEDDIRIAPEPTDNPEEANLIVDVQEKNTGEFNFGAGISSVEGVMGNFRLTQRNFDALNLPKSWQDLLTGNAFVGGGQDFTLNATGGALKQDYSVSLFDPWAFDRPVRAGGSIFHTVDKTYSDFQESDTGFSMSVGERLWGPRWDGEVKYRLSYTQIQNTDRHLPPILLDQDGSKYLSSLTPRLLYDSRDSRILPSRGFLAVAQAEIGGGPLGGTYNWVRPQLDIDHYTTVVQLASGGKHILELRGRAGLIEEYGKSNDVPPFMRYYAGGIDTIRGFEYRAITPMENHYPIGGKRMALGSAEYSVPLYEEIVRGAVFSDAGNVWDAGKIDPRTTLTNASYWRATMGFGLSIRTPLSPMPFRIYFSRAVSQTENDRPKTIDFTFGTSF